MDAPSRFFATLVEYAWGMPLIVLLVGGGAVLVLWSRLTPFRALRHTIQILRGQWDDPDAPGEISHFQALATAIASTVGVANIAGVAVAITQGGPGAIFWMWVTAGVGMVTKFFTCTLAAMYRKDDDGVSRGGPMYYIEIGLGKKFRFLAVFFSACGLVGCLAMMQANQVAEAFQSSLDVDRWISGVVIVVLAAAVVLGGIQRIGRVASALVPAMCIAYVGCALIVVAMRADQIPTVFGMIIHDAFTGTAAVGGFAGVAVREVIVTGVKRAAFSSEAGVGTAPIAHGAAKTDEPIREGLVAMFGPFIDTLVICSMTAFVLLTTDLWQQTDVVGVALTSQAFEAALGGFGRWVILVSVAAFGFSTMVGYSFYGKTCFGYLFGHKHTSYYDVVYLGALLLGAIWSVDMVVNMLDSAFAFMALPNMIATLLLAPRVIAAMRDYFRRYPARGMPPRPSHEPAN